jgi:membrane protein DedA with SNARE-associated domain
MDFLHDIILPLAGSPWLYVIALVLVILDGFFPLFPSEAVIVALAALAASSETPHLLPLLLTATIGAIVADNATYLIGRALGRQRLENLRPVTRLLGWADASLQTRPAMLVLVARFIPWARLAVNLTAGTVSYPYRRFVPLCVLASTLWAAYNVAMGYLAGRWFAANPLLGMALAILLAILMGIALDRVISLARRRNRLGV